MSQSFAEKFNICKHEDTYIKDTKLHREERCRKCDAWIKNVPKPENEKKRHVGVNNAKWRPLLRKKYGGKLICEFCGISEELYRDFHVDHITEISEGGRDEFENVRSLCSSCHALRNNVQVRNKRLIKIIENNEILDIERTFEYRGDF